MTDNDNLAKYMTKYIFINRKNNLMFFLSQSCIAYSIK